MTYQGGGPSRLHYLNASGERLSSLYWKYDR
jgi:hypothetical protein